MKIEIDNLTKTIQGSTVLDSIHVTLCNDEKGMIYGFQGINGSGKTMLMRMICGLVLPTKGFVRIDGKTIGRDLSFPPSLGVLLENPAFIDEFTGFKNLQLLCGIKKAVTDEQIHRTLTRVGLDHNDRRTYRKYSLGMKQRLGIAAAIVESPDLSFWTSPSTRLMKAALLQYKNFCFRSNKRVS